MYITKYQSYPNNEIRATMYRAVARTKFLARPVLLWAEFHILTAIAPSETAKTFPAIPSLDISSKVDQRGEKMPHRRTKFGLSAKRTLLRLGGAYDTVDKDPSHYIFLTGTIPGGTHEAFLAVAKQSSYITHSIAKWLRRTCPSQYWFYVWELQKRGALHIHYCIHAPDTRISNKILCEWRSKWESILEEAGRKEGADVWLRKDGTYHTQGHDVLQAYAQTVRKSVAAYLAGYCGGSKDKHSLDSASPYYPGRWWGCSRESTKLLRELTQEVTIEHTNYRDANRNLRTHYERVLHDSPKAHYYPHKVGVGATVVSYHPEDKGEKIWQELNPMLYKHKNHPNTASTIATYRSLIQDTVLLIEASPQPVLNLYRPLLTQLRDLAFPAPAYGYSIARRDITTVLQIPSDLNSPLCTVRQWERLRLFWVLLQDSLKEALPKLEFDKNGYICNTGDVLKLLDNHWSWKYLGTKQVETTSDCSKQGEPEPSSLSLLNQLELPL